MHINVLQTRTKAPHWIYMWYSPHLSWWLRTGESVCFWDIDEWPHSSDPWSAHQASCKSHDTNHKITWHVLHPHLSASSSTNISMVCKLNDGVLWRWSTSLPGVAMMMSGLLRNAASWARLSNPPKCRQTYRHGGGGGREREEGRRGEKRYDVNRRGEGETQKGR